ncbi:hypothetical protein Cgig2_015963 [Carnegiea gigantea]|uniref:DUF3741 domain-containing protein n=1 Tax=Carnegiea gigantea TaxID=171969 RepID=A0A9Q1KP70_9CARY|nr:hypothetical protein Cgig2_015963 [Carnegiea gigantea]
MRFATSSSVSSSSTANSFRENFCTSKGSNLGCLSGFLSRILCSKTLPTHPSDPIETDKKQGFLKIVDDDSTTPNVVARLMGLDLMPEFTSRITQQGSDSIKQNKLVNSGDLREETGEIHRRAKTSFSFKETPEFFELEDDDFFVPSKVEKTTTTTKKKTGVKFGNSEVGVRGHKQRGRREKCVRKQSRNGDERSKNRVFSIEDRLSLKISAQNSQKMDKNISVRNQGYHLSPLKEESDGIKARKKKKKDSCLDESKEECDSENLSPVSVLDHSEFISDHEAATSEEDVKLREGSHPRRDLDLDLVRRDFACDQIQSHESSMWEERERGGSRERVGMVGLNRTEWRKHEILSRVHRLAEAEITASPTDNSKWKYRGMLRTTELEDASTEFGHLIFDHLLSELVHQLLGLQCQDF